MISTYRRGEAEILASAIQSQKHELARQLASVTHEPPDSCNWQIDRMGTAYTRLAGSDTLFTTNDN